MNPLQSGLWAHALTAAIFCTTPLYAQDSEQALKSVIAEQQKQLPIMLDPISRIDNISYANHNVLYNITLYGFENRPGERVYYESYLAQQIPKALCSQTAYLLLLGLGNKITYSYSSSQAEPITEVTFGPDTCPQM